MSLGFTQPLRLLLPIPDIIGKSLPEMGIGEIDDHFVPALFLRPFLGPFASNELYQV